MQINLELNLYNNVLELDYRKYIISLIKESLSRYDNELYLDWYNNKDTNIKPFTFSVYLPNPKFDWKGDKIELNNNFIKVCFKMPNSPYFIRLYNALRQRCEAKEEFKLKNNSMTLKRLSVEKIPLIFEDRVIIQMNSPVIARFHSKEDNKNKYYYSNDIEFNETLKINIQNVINKFGLDISLDNFEMKSIKTSNTVIKLYDNSVAGSLGIFELSGTPELINFLNQYGIGSLRSSGFGSFKIIK